MKYLILLGLFSCVASMLSAQDNYVPNANILINAPEIPLVSRVTIDYTNVYENKEHVIYDFEYKWTQNNTNVVYEDLWNDYYAILDSNGDVVYYESKSKTYPYPYQIQDTYEYDSQHRVIKRESGESLRTIAYYTNSDTDSVVTWSYESFLGDWLKIEKEEIKHSDSYFDRVFYTYNNETKSYDYKFTNRNYLDSEGRVVKSMDIDSSSGSIYEYIYEENGYTELITYYGGSHASFKKEYVYNNEGDVKSYYYYEWVYDSYWEPCILTEYTYNYITALREEVELDRDFSIRGCDLLFADNIDDEVSIYTIKGICVFKGKVPRGKIISLPAEDSIYILRIGNKVCKILCGRSRP